MCVKAAGLIAVGFAISGTKQKGIMPSHNPFFVVLLN
jgi:hypothetical protein